MDQASLSVDYSLLITGGTGAGTFSPLIIADGVSNESSFPDLWPLWGGYAFVTSPVTLSAGDPDPGSHPFAAVAFCSPSDSCLLQFTFGVPLDLHFNASVNALIGADTGNATLNEAAGPFTTSVQFQGVAANTFPALLAILAAALAYRRRHWIIPDYKIISGHWIIRVCRFWLP
jgi:hypothetical protein